LSFVVLAGNPCLGDLLDYVAQPDSSYKWEKVDSGNNILGSSITLSMISQTWQGITWKHRIDIFTPAECEYPSTAILVITGGNGGGASSLLGQALASSTKCPVAVLFNIPNQPLFDNKREDALIAFTFIKALETNDLTWPLLLPMTKSAVRAMDTVQAYSQQEMKCKITGFVVGGASKRGWTTWLTAAADPVRVKGIFPMVYDNLNIGKQMKLQLGSYGSYSEQIHDYTELGVQEKLKTKAGQELAKVIDPWYYRDRITMPKLIMNGANDPFWTLTSLNIYWNDLVGEMNVVYFPNAGHGLGMPDDPSLQNIVKMLSPIVGFARAIASGSDFPGLDWKYNCDAKGCGLDIKVNPSGKIARLWVSKSSSKDFRKAKWEPRSIPAVENGFRASVELPKEGYTAMFGEVIGTNCGVSFPLCTQIRMFSKQGPVYP
jgi:PhoPQ-activated pathogenicity-related protein